MVTANTSVRSGGNRWSPRAELFLVKNFGKISFKHIASILGRTPDAVARKARHMGLV